jgi:Ni/Co efflux regulator RcnB
MKRMLMAIMAVAVLVAFSAPSFAEEGKKKGKDKKDAPKLVQMLNADEDKDKKDEQKGGQADEGKKKKKDQEEKGK